MQQIDDNQGYNYRLKEVKGRNPHKPSARKTVAPGSGVLKSE
jgi:hypothetical protein